MVESVVEEAVRSYLNQMTPEALAKSNAYFEGGYWLLLWNYLLSMVIAAYLMWVGLSKRMSNLAKRTSRFSFVQTMVYAVQYFLLTYVLSFPLGIYQGYFREHQYALSNLTLGAWFSEELKGLLVGTILLPIFLAIVYALIARLKKSWWIGGAIASTLFMAFVILISPVYLDPIFNNFKPLRAGEIRDSVLALAHANGVPANEIYEFDASKQSKRISANVSGLFNTMRVSLNDNLLTRSDLPEIRHVMGHEIGHYVLGHVFNHLISFGVFLFSGFYLVSLGMNYYLKKWGPQHGVKSLYDIVGLPVFLALLTTFFFVATPIKNTIIRTAEVQADLFALNTAREPDAGARVALKLSEYRKLSPGYWEEVFFYDHPSGESRIRAAMTWKAQNLK